LNKILLSCITLLLLSAAVLTGTTASRAAQDPAKGTLDERLGADDGAALAILFGANMRGNLDTCD
jgi:hypothetical protein